MLKEESFMPEEGLPGPEEISDEENRVGAKKGSQFGAKPSKKRKFLTPENIPSGFSDLGRFDDRSSDPLDHLIKREEFLDTEEGKKLLREIKEAVSEDEVPDNPYINYEPKESKPLVDPDDKKEREEGGGYFPKTKRPQNKEE